MRGGLVDRDLGVEFLGETRIGHRRKHDLRAALGGREIVGRRKTRRRFHEACQHRGFRKRDLARGFSEVALRGGLHAIRAGAEIDAVEVELQNLDPW